MSRVWAEVAATVTDTAAGLEAPCGSGMINCWSNKRETRSTSAEVAAVIAPVGAPPEEGIYSGGNDGGESRTPSTRSACAIVVTAGSAVGAPRKTDMNDGR